MKHLAWFSVFAALFTAISSHASVSPVDKAILGTPPNYILNGGCEQSTYGYTRYNEIQAATFTNGSANIVITSTTGYAIGQQITLTTSAAGLPTNFAANTVYYVVSVVNSTTLTASATAGGTAITAGSAGSGTHKLHPVTPIAGTGGTPDITISTTTSSPLQDSASCTLVNSGGSFQGEGWAYAFTLATGQQGGVHEIDFNYVVNSGTFAAGSSGTANGDLTVWIYDVTNSLLIQPSVFYTVCSSTTTFCTFQGFWQASGTSTSYKLLWHVASVSTSAWTLKTDLNRVSPVTSSPYSSITPTQTVLTSGSSATYTVPTNPTPIALHFQACGGGGGGSSSGTASTVSGTAGNNTTVIASGVTIFTGSGGVQGSNVGNGGTGGGATITSPAFGFTAPGNGGGAGCGDTLTFTCAPGIGGGSGLMGGGARAILGSGTGADAATNSGGGGGGGGGGQAVNTGAGGGGGGCGDFWLYNPPATITYTVGGTAAGGTLGTGGSPGGIGAAGEIVITPVYR